MSERYARELLRRNVAQMCQTIGWNGIQSTPLDVLVHVLEKYVRTLGVESSRHAEQLGRTEPNLHDLGLVFRDLHVHLPELSEYARSVPPTSCPLDVERFPQPKESHLNFLKPGSHEVVTRPMHVHEHLPPMYPEKEQTPPAGEAIEVKQNGHDSPGRSGSPEISVTDSPEKKDPFKRPPDPMPLPPSKRPRVKLEEEECHTREISSVMMTMSGFLSPAREGKLPEAAAPALVSERHSEKHKANSHHSNVMRVPAAQASLERSEKKSKKSRLVNGKIMKSKKKDKHRSESSKSRHDRVDRVPPEQVHRHKVFPPPNHNHIPTPVPRLVPPGPALDNIRPIKQEPQDHLPLPTRHEPVRELNTIPTPRKIPIAKSPLVAGTLSHTPKSVDTSSAIIPPVEIKKEIIDDEEKLASQPDRSKLNIFKRISNKSKEDKLPLELNERHQGESSTNRIDGVTPQTVAKSDKQNANETVTKIKPQEFINNNSEGTAVDLSSKHLNLRTNEVISIDDDSLEMNPPYIKPDPDFIPTPVPVPVSKLKQFPFPRDIAIPMKVKKERKHKEKRDKSVEKATKLMQKQMFTMATHSHNAVPQNVPAQFAPKMKSPKLGRPPKSESSKFPQMTPNFPFFPSGPGRGLIPGPGLIPNPLIPGNDLYAGLANNPALRGLPPNLLANPFALGGPGLIPSTSFMQGPGMITSGFLGNFRQPPRMQQPRFPLLRRPSLEVIAVDNDDARKQPLSQIPPLREKDKSEKHKIPTIPNILQKHSSPNKNRTTKDILSKTSAFKMPTVTPDVTIQLNPPTIKQEVVKPEPPPPIMEPAPAPRIPIPEPLPETSITEIPKEKTKVDGEKKKEKLHKKEKKEKDGMKVKKKKDKKDKNKDKSEKRKDKDDSKADGKDKIKKEKKEKKKDKERPPAAVDALVPKLTLKLGSASPMAPSSPETFKLNIKPIKKESPELAPIVPKEEKTSRENSRSPELAQISALVTRPPKPKVSKHNHLPPEQAADVKAGSPPPQASNSSPPRKNRPPSSHSKYKRILFKPLSKRSNVVDDDTAIDLIQEEGPPPPTRVNADKSAPVQMNTPFYTDEHGNKVWVCPACGRPDNGSPMIGCDGCDCWYHWVCVGITVDPGVSEDWFCKSCIAKRAAMVTALAGVQTGRKRGRKPKSDRVKDGH